MSTCDRQRKQKKKTNKQTNKTPQPPTNMDVGI